MKLVLSYSYDLNILKYISIADIVQGEICRDNIQYYELYNGDFVKAYGDGRYVTDDGVHYEQLILVDEKKDVYVVIGFLKVD